MTTTPRRLNNDQLISVLALSKDATAVYTGEELIIEIANDAMIGFWGKDRSVIGQSFIDAVPELVGQPFFDLLIAVWRTGVTYEATDTAAQLRVDGKLQWFYYDFIYRAIKNEKGEVTCILHTATDVTVRHLQLVDGLEREQGLQEELTATNEELKSANAEVVSASAALSLSRQQLIGLNADLEQRVSLRTSELRSAHENSERQRDRMKRFFMQAPAGICILDGPDFVFELINPLYQQLFPEREVLGKPLLQAVPEVEGTPIWDILRGVYQTGKTFEGKELLIPLARTTDGPVENRYFNFTYQARQDETNTVDGILVFVIEVTEQVNTRKEVEQAQESLQMALDAADLGSYYINTTDRIFHPSPRLKEFFGFGPDEEVPYDAAINQIHEDYRQAAADLVETAITEGVRFDMEYPVVGFHDGIIRWVRGIGVVQHRDGKSFFTGVLHNITEQKLAEEKSAKLAAIIESSDDAIVGKTLESVITSWNASAERMFGYTAEEIIGQTIYKIIPADRQGEEPQILARVSAGERVEHFETKRITKNGQLIDVSVTVSPIKDSKGRIIGLSKIARDISEKKLDEVRKNDFIGMVSHELKTPLTSLIAIVQVLAARFRKSDDPFVPGALEKANRQLRKMSDMINGFLNVSRLESGKIQIDKQPFIVGDLVKEVISEIKLIGVAHIIELKICDKVVINADRDKIYSVLSNVLSNAVKYSPKGSRIAVDCRKLEMEMQVSVQDEGIGIRPEDCKKLFERYYRVDSDITRHVAGFGIGLYLSAEIIQRHNGHIWVKSVPGKGSTFYFTLPLANRSL